jgi:hypothetical protein
MRLDSNKQDGILTGVAELVAREERKRARDIAAAIEDFETAEGPQKAVEAGNVLAASKLYHSRLMQNVAVGMSRVIEEIGGISLDEIMEDGLDTLAIEVSGSGEIRLGNHDQEIDEMKLVGDDEPDPDTTPAGKGAIEGIDLGDAGEMFESSWAEVTDLDVGDRVENSEGEKFMLTGRGLTPGEFIGRPLGEDGKPDLEADQETLRSAELARVES